MKIALTGLVLCWLSIGQAALPPANALEVLSLPEGSRLQVAKTQPQSFYNQLMQMAFSDEPSLQNRWKALNLAAAMEPTQATTELERALAQKEWFMRSAALVAYKNTQPEQVETVATRMIGDKALVVRSTAVGILPDAPTPQMRDRLWAELQQDYNFHKGQSLWVRSEIVEKLALHPENHEKSRWIACLHDEDVKVQTAAIEGLERLTGQKRGSSKSSLEEKRQLWLK